MNPFHLCLACCIIMTGVRGSSCPVREGGVNVRSVPVTLKSPNYGLGDYPANVRCSWTLWANRAPYRVRMEVLDIDLERHEDCAFDYLEVKDTDGTILGRLCGNTGGTFRSSGDRLYLTFKTDGSQQKRGFKVQFSLDSGEVTTTMSGPPQIDSCPKRNDDTFTAGYSYMDIMSEGYPRSYPDDSFCMWNLRAATAGHVVKLEVVDSDLESSSSCSYDFLAAYDGYSEMSSSSLIRKWCGYTAPTLYSSGRYMTLVFKSDSSMDGRGFHIRFMQVPASEAESYSSKGVTIGVVSAVVFVVFIVVVCISCFIRARVASSRCSGGRQQRAQRGNVTSAGVAATSASRHLGFTGGALYNRQASSVSLPQPLDPPAFAPPPYPGGPDPSTLPKDEPPPYWMAAMYTVDPGAQHLPKPEGHVPDDVTSAPAPHAPAPPPPPHAPAPHASAPHAPAPPPPAPVPHAPALHAPAPNASAAHAAGSVEPSAPFSSGERSGDLTASGVARGGAGVAPPGGDMGRDNRGYAHDDDV